MKVSALVIASSLVAAQAFAPAFTRGTSSSTRLYSEPEKKDGDGLDLNLEEMFEMFDAADKEENFDDAVKKVKGKDEKEKKSK